MKGTKWFHRIIVMINLKELKRRIKDGKRWKIRKKSSEIFAIVDN